MKLSLITTVLLLAGQAFAAEPTVLLKSTTSPLNSLYNENPEQERTLSLLADGSVVVTEGGQSKTLKALNVTKIATVKALIAQASGAELENNFGEMVCLAIPTRQFLITANDGAVVLSRGSAPCGGNEYNATPAGQELLELVRELDRASEN